VLQVFRYDLRKVVAAALGVTAVTATAATATATAVLVLLRQSLLLVNTTPALSTKTVQMFLTD
jgi:hypothetical protein